MIDVRDEVIDISYEPDKEYVFRLLLLRKRQTAVYICVCMCPFMDYHVRYVVGGCRIN